MAGTTITDDTTIEGNVTTASTLTVAGEIKGNVHAGGAVTVMSDGLVKGDVSGPDVTIHGKVEGRISATGKLVLTRTAMVQGDVACRSLSIEEGGTLAGRCDMGKSATKPAAATAAAAPAKKRTIPAQAPVPRPGNGAPLV